MTDLAAHLDRLGLVQYLDAFADEGFDSWDTLCDVQESDLERLNVKLGHRRKLQRAIADHRGISVDRLILGSPAAPENSVDPLRSTEGLHIVPPGKEGATGSTTEPKRKYRRHPKIDDNAPEKPPSAYVLFSNQVREEVKAENLTFTEIAQLVGARWQKLEPVHKEPFESRASSLKEQYNTQLSAYKKTDAFKEYNQYLNDFRAKHGPQAETKRPKLDAQSSGGSLSATSVDIPDSIPVTSGHGRVGSMSSINAASLTSTMTSPPGMTLAPVLSTITSSVPAMSSRGFPPLHRPGSPQTLQYRGGPRLLGQLSSHSSISDDSGQVPPYDALSRTATLSLSTPPTGTPPLPQHGPGPTRLEPSNNADSFAWPPRASQTGHQHSSITPSGSGPLGAGITLPSPTMASESWRGRELEWARQIQTSPTASTVGQAPALPLPPLLGPERISDFGPTHAQRILPPLRQNPPPGLSPTSYQSHSVSSTPRPASEEHERRFSTPYDAQNRQLDRNENEAASTLAGLAARPGTDTPQSRSYDRRRP